MQAVDGIVIVGGDGLVLGTAGDAPADWVDARIEARSDVPRPFRDAVREVAREAHRAPGRVALAQPQTLTSTHLPRELQVIAIEALPIRRHDTDLRALLAAIMKVMLEQARALDVLLNVTVHATVPELLRFDPEKIAWAITALVGNALRHVRHGSPGTAGGTISVAASHDARAGELSLAVFDDGPGIAPEKLEALLRRQPGHINTDLLGLLLVHDVIAAHGGRVDVRSGSGGADSGTSIVLRIPA